MLKQNLVFTLLIFSYILWENKAQGQFLSQIEVSNNKVLKNNHPINDSSLHFIPRDLTAKDDKPDRSESKNKLGGEKCPSLKPTLTALVPSNNQAESLRSLTAQARPNFWFYVPYSLDSQFQAEFVLLNNENKLINQQIISLRKIPGIIKISLSISSFISVIYKYIIKKI